MNSTFWLARFLPFLNWLPKLDKGTIRTDVLAGITAGVLIIPQAIALATVAGLPPQYGLYTSIFPVIIAGLWGSSMHVLSGPNTALAVMMAMSIAPFANIATPEYIQYALTLTFLVGGLSLVIGMLRLGEIFNYFSHTAMMAIVTGVGIIIIVQQIGNFLGVHMNNGEDFIDTLQQAWIAIGRANPYAVAVGTVTVVTGLLVQRLGKKWPHYIIAVVVGGLFAQLLGLIFGRAATDLFCLGYLHFDALPFSAPDFSPQSFSEFSTVAYPAAFSMTMLALMQSAVIARNTAAKSGQQGMDINQEIIGQGLSNVIGSFLSSFASCGSFNRSAANLEAGAKTQVAGIVSALVVIALVVIATPLLAWLPMPVVAGILFLVGAALVRPKDAWNILHIRCEGRYVYLMVLATTLFSGLDSGVFLGVFLSIALYLRSASRPEMDILAEEEIDPYLLSGMSRENTTTVSLAGNLYFGSVQHLEKLMMNLPQDTDLSITTEYVTVLDLSAAEALALEVRRRRQNGHRMVMWLRPQLLGSLKIATVLKDALGDDLRTISRNGDPVPNAPLQDASLEPSG